LILVLSIGVACEPIPQRADFGAVFRTYVGILMMAVYLSFWVGVVVLIYKVTTRFFEVCRDVAEIKALLRIRNPQDPARAETPTDSRE